MSGDWNLLVFSFVLFEDWAGSKAAPEREGARWSRGGLGWALSQEVGQNGGCGWRGNRDALGPHRA